MPRKTSAGLVPVIVYLDEDDHSLLERMAKEQDRSMSQMGRVLMAGAFDSYRQGHHITAPKQGIT